MQADAGVCFVPTDDHRTPRDLMGVVSEASNPAR